ncbi:MAG: polysaccharide deacetylase family protein [Verrucomicrobia bacterium]|nr:polysaccharide deacetylase family protein [Verrucomicrobiota bacterium]
MPPAAPTPDHLPRHYDRLAAFLDFFQSGVPILTYHAIAPPPRGTKFRGLFYEPEKFARQLAELRAEGFRTTSLEETTLTETNSARRIALTFDDGYASLCAHALAPLAENKFHAVVFLVADLIGRKNEWDAPVGVASAPLMDAAQVREWLAAGHAIGSHTLTHPHLHEIPPARAREEIFASRRKLEDTFGVAVKDFCYPYGHSNEHVRELVAEAGYATACTTRFGLNTAATPPLALNRITVRRPARSLKTFQSWAVRNALALAGRFHK